MSVESSVPRAETRARIDPRHTILSFEQALALVRAKLEEHRREPPVETVRLLEARGRVLAQDIVADRDYPPFDRAARDGYAVRSEDVVNIPVWLDCVGEARAGKPYPGRDGDRSGVAVEIMTGAPVPSGFDAVVMVEHTRAEGRRVEVRQKVAHLDNLVGQGSEARAGAQLLARGRRLDSGAMGLLASAGQVRVKVLRRPIAAILPTGDEVVPVEAQPQWYQIRNSNGIALAAQVAAMGAVPRLMGIAPDEEGALRSLIERGLESDLLLLSGGVSAGRYDLVEPVLEAMGAEFYFRGVAIRPGKPLVFGRLADTFFFGLPGNPVSTYVTCELFVRPAITVLAGAAAESTLFLRARLREPFRQNHGLTAFVPARVEMLAGDPVVRPAPWQGSGDLAGFAGANCLLVVQPDQRELPEGTWVDVLTIRG